MILIESYVHVFSNVFMINVILINTSKKFEKNFDQLFVTLSQPNHCVDFNEFWNGNILIIIYTLKEPSTKPSLLQDQVSNQCLILVIILSVWY